MIIEYEQAYGLWSLVIINALVFIIFAFSFATPRTGRDWRSLSVFSTFTVAIVAEADEIAVAIGRDTVAPAKK